MMCFIQFYICFTQFCPYKGKVVRKNPGVQITDITVNLLRKGYLVPVISGQGQVANGPENSLLAPPNNEAACQKPWLRAWICKHCRIFIQFLGPKLGFYDVARY